MLCLINMNKIYRFPKNAVGDFYTTGYKDQNDEWSGECMKCDLPEAEAPLLMAQLTGDNDDTYFLKQPENPVELEQAICATEVCCLDAVRYGGKDKMILRKLAPEITDYKISILGIVVPNKWWLK